RIRPRSAPGIRDHTPDSNACRAVATARSTSSAEPAASVVMRSSVAGLRASIVSPDAAGTQAPPIRRPVSGMVSGATSGNGAVMALLLGDGGGRGGDAVVTVGKATTTRRSAAEPALDPGP